MIVRPTTARDPVIFQTEKVLIFWKTNYRLNGSCWSVHQQLMQIRYSRYLVVGYSFSDILSKISLSAVNTERDKIFFKNLPKNTRIRVLQTTRHTETHKFFLSPFYLQKWCHRYFYKSHRYFYKKSPFFLEMSPFFLQKLISSICHRFCIRSEIIRTCAFK